MNSIVQAKDTILLDSLVQAIEKVRLYFPSFDFLSHFKTF